MATSSPFSNWGCCEVMEGRTSSTPLVFLSTGAAEDGTIVNLSSLKE
jgi:hypothetical protein